MNVLKTMRNMQMLKVLLWIVVISFLLAIFALWGGGLEYEEKNPVLHGREYAVRVDDEILPPAAFTLQYRLYSEQVKSMLGDNFREDFLRGAPQRIASSMADNLVLAQLARSYGLSVSDEELATTINRMYRFKDPATEYPIMLQRMGISAGDYEELLRNELLVEKLRTVVADTHYLSTDELKKLYSEDGEKVNAMVAVIPFGAFGAKVGPVDEAELKARYERDKATLKTPEKRTMEYILVAPSSVRNAMKADESKLRGYSQAHMADFGVPADQRQASHILIRVTEADPPAKKEEALKRAESLAEKARAGADFAELARANSDDPGSAKNGGDLGWFSRERMVKPFADAVFDQAKKVGDIVGPVQTQFGYHIIKLTGIGGQAKPFESVKEQVRQTYLLKDPEMAKAIEAKVAELRKAVAAAKDDAGVKAAVEPAGLKTVTVERSFGETDPIFTLGKDAKLSEAAFKAKKGEWSEPVVLSGDRWLRFKITGIEPAHPATFDEAKLELERTIRTERAKAMAESAARQLASSKDAASLEAAAKKENFQAQASGAINLSGTVPGVGPDKDVIKALLAGTPGSIVGPLNTANSYVVAAVTERTHADMAKFDKDRDEFARQRRRQAAEEYLQDYVAQRRAELEAKQAIHYNTDLIQRMEPTPART